MKMSQHYPKLLGTAFAELFLSQRPEVRKAIADQKTLGLLYRKIGQPTWNRNSVECSTGLKRCEQQSMYWHSLLRNTLADRTSPIKQFKD